MTTAMSGLTPEQTEQARAQERLRHQYELVKALQASPVWTEVLVPLLKKRIDKTVAGLRNRSRARQEAAPDDYLMGRWDEAEAWFNDLYKLVEAHEMEMREATTEMTEQEANLRALSMLGRFSPVTSAPPVPDERF